MSDSESISDCSIEHLSEHLQLLIEINNNLVQSIKYVEQLNNQLCKLVSNLNNIVYACDKQIERINESI